MPLSYFNRTLRLLDAPRKTRRYSEGQSSSGGVATRVIVSTATEPYWNLAFEEYLYHERRKYEDDSKWIYLWRNKPSVIIGRNQNPWQECNVPFIEKNGINLVRRQSGGGTVYHDLGNTCVTVLSAKHEPHLNVAFTCRAVQSAFGIQAYPGPRNDIYLDGCKVSGSAFRVSSIASYHHYTLLVNTDLSTLKSALLPIHRPFETKAISSVRAPTKNLGECSTKAITHEILCDVLEKHFKLAFPGDCWVVREEYHLERIQSIHFVAKTYEEFKSWEHIYGKTPPFHLSFQGSLGSKLCIIDIYVNNGMIKEFSVSHPTLTDESKRALRNSVIGLRYEWADFNSCLKREGFVIHENSETKNLSNKNVTR
ncbi:lipoate-protein ligase A-like [Schistocerca gregaria]|uniref:lipoate-protein ligase A-like n=1 Tax=Schistocerca gregaria TaxID=7010 RepID=UPI00211F08A1|nr:lipoate-protein ligase A-like [Schistocerca gregaria]